MLTAEQLKSIMPRLSDKRNGELLPFLTAAMTEFAIDTPARAAAFLAQLAHESGQFRFMEEIWGPTDAQRRYEPVTKLSAALGNTDAGDGKRFKGRGPIQLTGRANYQRFGDLLSVDLLADPPRAANPERRVQGRWTLLVEEGPQRAGRRRDRRRVHDHHEADQRRHQRAGRSAGVLRGRAQGARRRGRAALARRHAWRRADPDRRTRLRARRGSDSRAQTAASCTESPQARAEAQGEVEPAQEGRRESANAQGAEGVTGKNDSR